MSDASPETYFDCDSFDCKWNFFKQTDDTISCLSLLPYNFRSQLVSRHKKHIILKVLYFFLREIIEVLDLFFVEKKLAKFDPHIADTLCQIRAYKNILIIKNHEGSFDEDLFSELIKLNSIEKVMKDFLAGFENKLNSIDNYSKSLDRNESLIDFIKENNLIFTLSNTTFFLFQEKILTEFTLFEFSEVSRRLDYDKFSRKLGVSKSFVKKIMHYYQKNICKISCKFVYDLLKNLNSKYFTKLKILLPFLQTKDVDGREVLPCFEATYILIMHAIANGRNILLNIENLSDTSSKIYKLLFVPNIERNSFEFKAEICPYYFEPCMVIKGITIYSEPNFIDKITEVGLIKVIQANMAKHPQYSAGEFASISENPYKNIFDSEDVVSMSKDIVGFKTSSKMINSAVKTMANELVKNKKLSEKYGCHVDDVRLFFIKHIYCDILQNIVDHICCPELEMEENFSLTAGEKKLVETRNIFISN